MMPSKNKQESDGRPSVGRRSDDVMAYFHLFSKHTKTKPWRPSISLGVFIRSFVSFVILFNLFSSFASAEYFLVFRAPFISMKNCSSHCMPNVDRIAGAQRQRNVCRKMLDARAKQTLVLRMKGSGGMSRIQRRIKKRLHWVIAVSTSLKRQQQQSQWSISAFHFFFL